jgi:hypothetical protein
LNWNFGKRALRVEFGLRIGMSNWQAVESVFFALAPVAPAGRPKPLGDYVPCMFSHDDDAFFRGEVLWQAAGTSGWQDSGKTLQVK